MFGFHIISFFAALFFEGSLWNDLKIRKKLLVKPIYSHKFDHICGIFWALRSSIFRLIYHVGLAHEAYLYSRMRTIVGNNCSILHKTSLYTFNAMFKIEIFHRHSSWLPGKLRALSGKWKKIMLDYSQGRALEICGEEACKEESRRNDEF